MPDTDFFAKLGLCVAKNFLDAKSCARYRGEMRTASGEKAKIGGDPGGLDVDETIRRATATAVKASTMASVKARLQALKPALQTHFQVALTGFEAPQFLTYKPGDFYIPHTDKSGPATTFEKRKVTAVIFLNGEADAPGRNCYGGGALTFYGLIDKPRWKKYGFSLSGESGLLVAFRSNVLHEVQPVTHGRRQTIVTWFF